MKRAGRGEGDWRYERRFVIDIWALAKSGCGFEYWMTSDCTDDDGSMFAAVNSFFFALLFPFFSPSETPSKIARNFQANYLFTDITRS